MMKVLLLDIDGVLLQPGDLFSRFYAKQHGLDPSSFDEFFQGDFRQALKGDADLKAIITKRKDIWKWDKDIDDLIKVWFETETILNKKILSYIDNFNREDFLICVASNQEKLRGEYLREVVFPGRFDEYYISAEMGVLKPRSEFFQYIMYHLTAKYGYINASEIIYFDDSKENVESAKKLGINAHLYISDEKLIEELERL